MGISVYLPGVVATAEDAILYREALTKDMRWFNNGDISDLAPIVGDLADDDRFEIHQVKSEEWGLMKVLYVEGVWRMSETRNAKLFVDQRGDGRLIQKIGVYAPANDYPKFKLGLDALESIAWREQS